MITSLEDAWRWYEHARALARTTQRFAERHWDDLPWDGSLGRDDDLKELTSVELIAQSEAVLGDLDDLGVLLHFSVFESNVRNRVLTEIDGQVPVLQHPALEHAIAELREAIGHGSFFRVLEPYKLADAGLVEQVNQVRRYRNWVAHGRHGRQPELVEPRAAYYRLRRFLDWLDSSKSPDLTDVAAP